MKIITIMIIIIIIIIIIITWGLRKLHFRCSWSTFVLVILGLDF